MQPNQNNFQKKTISKILLVLTLNIHFDKLHGPNDTKTDKTLQFCFNIKYCFDFKNSGFYYLLKRSFDRKEEDTKNNIVPFYQMQGCHW